MPDPVVTTDPPAARNRKWLRRVGVVVGCLLAGAIVNVLVAWGCTKPGTSQFELVYSRIPVHGVDWEYPIDLPPEN